MGGKMDPGPELLACMADTQKTSLEKCCGKGKGKVRKNVSNEKVRGCVIIL